jgi:hypothetical protein
MPQVYEHPTWANQTHIENPMKISPAMAAFH